MNPVNTLSCVYWRMHSTCFSLSTGMQDHEFANSFSAAELKTGLRPEQCAVPVTEPFRRL